MADRYGRDVLAADWKAPKRGRSEPVAAELDQVVEDVASGFVGAVTRIERDLGVFELEDRRGKRMTFPFGPGFWIDGKPVEIVAPARKAPAAATRTASGSLAVDVGKAKVALPSRIYVEGRHDAELVEKVWGDDLRVEGVVVEYLGGIDDLESIVAQFGPTAKRKLGVLVDHLVPGSKESRIAATVAHVENVLVVGHPYIDVWQSVKPERLGWQEWPVIPRGTDFKKGICAALGWPHETQADIARAWKKILGQVRSWTDLEPEFLGRVEELIDFVTVD